jgi:hypothetical protein
MPSAAFLQIRRYVYCDVVRATDMSPHVDISGIQVCAGSWQQQPVQAAHVVRVPVVCGASQLLAHL